MMFIAQPNSKIQTASPYTFVLQNGNGTSLICQPFFGSASIPQQLVAGRRVCQVTLFGTLYI